MRMYALKKWAREWCLIILFFAVILAMYGVGFYVIYLSYIAEDFGTAFTYVSAGILLTVLATAIIRKVAEE